MGEKEHEEEKYKWEFAIGTTSRVPGSNLHYLILDIDTLERSRVDQALWGIQDSGCFHRVQKTPHGFHIYTNWKMPLSHFLKWAKLLGADSAWLRIGARRGYFFLADRREVLLEWPVERMVIHRGKEEGQALNAGRT